MGYGQDIAVLRSCWIGTSTFEQYESITAGQAVEMREVAEQAKIKHMVGFSWRCLPIIKGMYDLVKDGYIGTCFNGCGPIGAYREDLESWLRNRFQCQSKTAANLKGTSFQILSKR